MGEVPLYPCSSQRPHGGPRTAAERGNGPKKEPEKDLQGYLADKKTPTPLGLPQDSRHRPTVGS